MPLFHPEQVGAFTVFIFILAISLNALANILIKASALRKDEPGLEGLIKGVILNPYLIAGLGSFGLAFVAYRYVLGHGIKLSVAYPLMTTCGFAIVLLASRIFFNEILNFVQWLGIGLLVAGLWLIAFQPGGDP